MIFGKKLSSRENLEGVDVEFNANRDDDAVSKSGTMYSYTTNTTAAGRHGNGNGRRRRRGNNSLGDGASVQSGTSTSDGRPEYVDPVVAAKEQRQVLWSRATVMVVLAVAASILSAATYTLVSQTETAEFENQVSQEPTSTRTRKKKAWQGLQ